MHEPISDNSPRAGGSPQSEWKGAETWLVESPQSEGKGAQIEIRIFGGVPLSGLWRHGLTVAEYADDPAEIGTTRQQHMDAMQEVRAGLTTSDRKFSEVSEKPI
jgi:hypothetical protein